MNNDLRLKLAHAALACGKRVTFKEGQCKGGAFMGCFEGDTSWRPDQNDGDCARLEQVLQISIGWGKEAVSALSGGGSWIMPTVRYDAHGGDRQAARREATLTLAAYIGAQIEDDNERDS